MSRQKSIVSVSLVAALVACTVSTHSARAAVFAYEGFDYTPGVLAGSSGGSGWQGSWGFTATGTGSTVSNGTSVVAGLTFSDYPVRGNAAEVLAIGNTGTVAHRQIAISPALPRDSTVFTSMLFRHVQQSTSDNASAFTVGSTAFEGQNKLQSQAVTLFGVSNPDNIGTGSGNSSTRSPTGGIAGGTTYLFIGKFTGLNIPAFNNAVNTATLWALSEANYDAIKADGITEAELDANNVARAFRGDGPSNFGTSFGGGDFVRLLASTNFGVSNRSVFDELKFANELNDIVPIPEPTLIASITLFGATLILRRRKAK